MERRRSDYLRPAESVPFLVLLCFTAFYLIMSSNGGMRPASPPLDMYPYQPIVTSSLQSDMTDQPNAKNAIDCVANTSVKDKPNGTGWPDAERELGIAYSQMAASWNPDWVYRGSPVNPLPEYKSTCWEEIVTKKEYKEAYTHNGFIQANPTDERTTLKYFVKPIRSRLMKSRRHLTARYRKKNHTKGQPFTRFRCLPFLYMIGMYKAGSTDLFMKISQHPQLIQALTKSSQYPKKRISFHDYLEFLDPVAELIKQKPRMITMDAYARLFKLRYNGSKYRKRNSNGDIRNISHLFLEEVKHYNPNAMFLLALRDPVTWIYSAYNYWLKGKGSPRDFHGRIVKGIAKFRACVSNHDVEYCVISKSMNVSQSEDRVFEIPYFVFVKEIRKVIPEEKLIIIRAEDYYLDQASVLSHVFQKIGLDPMSNHRLRKKSNIRNKNKYAPMLNRTEHLLREFAMPYNKKLVQLLGRPEFHWT